MNNLTLHTERLTLRPFTLDNAGFILTLVNSPTWLQHIGNRNIQTLQHAKAYLINGPLLSYQQHGFGLMAVCLKGEDTLVGMCGLVKRDSLPEPDLGYALLPDCEGKGYGTEIAQATIDYYRQQLNIKRILAITMAANTASIRVLQKTGFRYDKLMDGQDGAEPLLLFVQEFA